MYDDSTRACNKSLKIMSSETYAAMKNHKKNVNRRHARGAPAAAAPSHPLRLDMLRILLDKAGQDSVRLSQWIGIKPERLQAMLAGRLPLGNEYATHIEEALGLPAAWLDGQHGLAVPADFDPSKLPHTSHDEDDEEQSTTMVTTHKPQHTLTPAAPARVGRARRTSPVTSEIRRANIQLLTARRGSKNELAQLSEMNSSRISLMTSGHKPVSDPFATAIERALDLPAGWLDTPREIGDVPNQVWRKLGGFPEPQQSAPSHAPRAAATPRATSAQSNPTAEHAQARPQAHATANAPAHLNPVFSKTHGQAGAIAEALARKVLEMSCSGKLAEDHAFRLLGELIKLDA